MKTIGVTGNVASGKNTVTDCLVKILPNAVVFDADAEVGKLLKKQEIINQISKNFSKNIKKDSQIDRQKLGSIVFKDKKKLAILENIIHPEIAKKREIFLEESKKKHKDFAILNIPLLFEKNLHYLFHKTILIICDEEIKKRRFFLRAKHQGLSSRENDFYQKLNNQNTDFQNYKNADLFIQNNGNLIDLFKKVEDIANKL
jgi:dephospho-CoA kinase